jgi:hypothetical protein
MRSKSKSGAAIATSAAMLFGTAFVGTVQAAEEGKVMCTGVNSCKGHSACKTAKNECKGMNSCKGEGFLELTKEECAAAQAKMKDEKK